ncbi:hypothetical protein QN277_028706 [Acacia crassicarpa]|uniref:Peptidase metallopeptidase domain-containing protein n=1 Tax=Acacia crassicarpa TaxID=499986 RepID=A0AAE1K3S2_9FABA|nr:hypothetical protein QN277_028706 [Acacia crassicarpa]
MRVRKAYIVVLILALLIANESSPLLLRPASANLLFLIPLGLEILKLLDFGTISKVLDLLISFLSAHGGRIRTGTVVKGLSTVKRYFDLFGFLESTLSPNFTDEFSDDLESAIKYFQKTFHLNVTGQPDNTTVSLIKRPRCGLPDIINGSSNVLMNHTAATASFTKWWPEGKKELTYAFSPQNETGLLLKDTFADAFRRWSEVTRLNFTETTSFNESDIQIMFLSLDGNLGVVGGAWLDNTTRNWDVVLDSSEKWVWRSDNTTESDEMDMESVVMHQIGHVLGLNHSAVEEAVMYPFISPSNKRKVDFANDDLEKIRKLYSEKSNSSELSPANSPSPDDKVVAGVGHRWGPVSTLWLGIILLF